MSSGSEPLPLRIVVYRNLGEDASRQVRRGVGHAARSAGGTESSTLKRVIYDPHPDAVVAADAEKASVEEAASEEGSELTLDEARDDAALIAGGGEECLEALLARILLRVRGVPAPPGTHSRS